MLPRVLEPEVMDTAEEAVDYDAMDHSRVNRVFVDDLLGALRSAPAVDSSRSLQILDVGTGTALIPLELCRRKVDCHVTAIDLAEHMLALGRTNVARAGLESRIVLERIDAKGMPYADASFDAVMSNSIVHHIPEPLGVLAEMVRVLRPGGLLFVRDLLRPRDMATVDQLVTRYAGDANVHQQQMFRDSLCAALTLEELREMLVAVGLPAESVRQTTDRHWTLRYVCG